MSLYLGNGYDEQFSQWFATAHNAVYPEFNITDRSALNVTIVVTQSCNFKCSYCVSGDTLITMSDFSLKQIKDVNIHDKIIAFEEYPSKYHSNTLVSEVEQFHKHKDKLIRITLEDEQYLEVTKNHKLLTQINSSNEYNYIYIEAGNLKVGNSIYTLLHQDIDVSMLPKKIVSIEYLPTEVDVYNLGTSSRTYFANGLAVHNCYQHGKTQDKMTVETAKKAVDFLLGDEINNYIDKDNTPAIILDFIGGEPLLEIDLIDAFMDYFLYKAFKENHRWAVNYSIGMSSNGSLYGTPKVQKFVKKYWGRCHIAITIDGMKELHDSCRVYPNGKGTFDDVYKNIKLYFANNGHPSTKITIAPENLKYLCESTLFLFDMGYKWLNGNVVFENVWNLDYAKELYFQMKKLADIILERELYKEHRFTMFDDTIGRPIDATEDENWCGSTSSMLAIGTDGLCYPCLRYMKYCLSTPEREPLIIGDIYNGVDKNIEIIQNMRKITRSSQSTEECFNCPIAKGCAWCSAYNYDIFGTSNKRATFLCVMQKARTLANVYYWNKLYQKLKMDKNFPYYMPDEWALEIIDDNEIKHLKELALGGQNE